MRVFEDNTRSRMSQSVLGKIQKYIIIFRTTNFDHTNLKRGNFHDLEKSIKAIFIMWTFFYDDQL